MCHSAEQQAVYKALKERQAETKQARIDAGLSVDHFHQQAVPTAVSPDTEEAAVSAYGSQLLRQARQRDGIAVKAAYDSGETAVAAPEPVQTAVWLDVAIPQWIALKEKIRALATRHPFLVHSKTRARNSRRRAKLVATYKGWIRQLDGIEAEALAHYKQTQTHANVFMHVSKNEALKPFYQAYRLQKRGSRTAVETAVVKAPAAKPAAAVQSPEVVKIHPFLWCASNKNKLQAVFKVRAHLDAMRRNKNYLTHQQIKAALVETAVYNWDYLHKLLKRGHGIFWTYEQGARKVWCYTPSKVANILDVQPSEIEVPVFIPASEAAHGLERFNAAAYGAFMASLNANQQMPISRAVQSQLTGLNPRTLRKYTRLSAAITRKSHYTVCDTWQAEAVKEMKFEHETAVFPFIDYKGKHGAVGEKYAVRELPSSYEVDYAVGSYGSKIRLQKKLFDLRKTRYVVRNEKPTTERRYYDSDYAAAKSISRGQAAYWPQFEGVSTRSGGAYQFWQGVAAM